MEEIKKSQLENFKTIECSLGGRSYGIFCEGFIKDENGFVRAIPLSSISTDMKKMIINLLNDKDIFDGVGK